MTYKQNLHSFFPLTVLKKLWASLAAFLLAASASA